MRFSIEFTLNKELQSIPAQHTYVIHVFAYMCSDTFDLYKCMKVFTVVHFPFNSREGRETKINAPRQLYLYSHSSGETIKRLPPIHPHPASCLSLSLKSILSLVLETLL